VILDRGSELTATSDLWRADISRLGAIALVGAAAWLWHWYQVQQSIVTNPDAERSATVRRTFLFAVIAVSIIAVLSSLAVVIYRLLAAILNVTDVGPRSELHTPIAASIVAGMVLAYHAFILRDDLAARADEVASSMSFDLTISGPPDADVEEIVSTLRAHLPSGFTITRS
jgi:hypothetical protein